jgi:hypothetical protein
LIRQDILGVEATVCHFGKSMAVLQLLVVFFDSRVALARAFHKTLHADDFDVSVPNSKKRLIAA